MSRHIGTIWAVALFVCCGISTTFAGTISGGFVVEVSSSLGSASREFVLDTGGEFDEFNWSLGENVDLVDESTGATVATIFGDTSLTLDGDPVVQLSFNVQAGAAATNVTVASPTLFFAEIPGAIGRASAGTTVVDFNGNGASITGGYAGGTRSFQASYNAGTVFQEMVGNSTVNTAYGAMSQSEEYPAGFQPLGAVSNIETEFSFTLSGGDFAVGNSVFAVLVPEPATATLGLLVGLALVGFRRRQK